MKTKLFDYQKKAVTELKTGSILWGGVGSGKSLTALVYYYVIECGGVIEPSLKPMIKPKSLYIITTARKREELDWDKEASNFGISKDSKTNINNISFVVDSWNNIGKYKSVKDAFFIFDEQKVIGYGAWVKAFLKISKSNNWILLTATPGDTWMDYLPVFIANGFYKNKTDFTRNHVVYNTFTSYPKIDRYVGTKKLQMLKKKILVKMEYVKKTIDHIIDMVLPYDKEKFELIYKERWNPYKNQPIQNGSEAYYTMRMLVNSDPSRLEAIIELIKKHKKIIVFYNFDYELDILRKLNDRLDIPIAEYNGHIHEPIPKSNSWIYLVQYISASEAWNCIETNAIILYSKNYSYKMTKQSMGRIDRQNTPFLNLYYYFFSSDSFIDKAIGQAYREKKNFNERKYYKFEGVSDGS